MVAMGTNNIFLQSELYTLFDSSSDKMPHPLSLQQEGLMLCGIVIKWTTLSCCSILIALSQYATPTHTQGTSLY